MPCSLRDPDPYDAHSKAPAQAIPSALETGGGGQGGVVGGRVSLVVGAFLAAVVYSALVYAMYVNMKNSFMMTVRKLAGAN